MYLIMWLKYYKCMCVFECMTKDSVYACVCLRVWVRDYIYVVGDYMVEVVYAYCL